MAIARRTQWISRATICTALALSASQAALGNTPRQWSKAIVVSSTARDSLVKCSLGQVAIRKSSVVYVLNGPSATAVYNLHSEPGGVKLVLSNNQTVAVPVGQELVLTSSAGLAFSELQKPTHISCRQPEEFRIGDGIRGFVADFSLPSAIISVPLLKTKLHSTDTQDRHVMNRVLKTAVSLHIVTGNRGPFTADF